MFADDEAISELSLLLMERIIERKEAEKAGMTHDNALMLEWKRV